MTQDKTVEQPVTTAAETATPPPRRYRPTGFADLLPGAMQPALSANGFWHQEIVMEWPVIVGNIYGQHSIPRRLQFPKGQRTEGVLTVATTGSVALLMQHQVMVILERINTYFGYRAVAAIKFQQVDAVYLQQLRAEGA